VNERETHVSEETPTDDAPTTDDDPDPDAEGVPDADLGLGTDGPLDSGEGSGDDVVFEAAPDSRALDRESGETGVVVPKSTYCERCAFFADPPTVACTRDGTEIREFVDRDRVRVVGCPVVAERERLDQ
jgi:hypothetical protein